MEGFDLTNVDRSEDCIHRRGGGVVLYQRRNSNGRFTSRSERIRYGNPFSSGIVAVVVVGYLDSTHLRDRDRQGLALSERIAQGDPGDDGEIRTRSRARSLRPFELRDFRTRLVTSVTTGRRLDMARARHLGTACSGTHTPHRRFGFFLPGTEDCSCRTLSIPIPRDRGLRTVISDQMLMIVSVTFLGW